MTAARPSANEIRTSRKAERLGATAGWLMRMASSTWRARYIDRCGILERDGKPRPVIVLLWHNRIFAGIPLWRKTCGQWRDTVALTSASHDGAAVASAAAVFGLGAVRGSSSRRGAAALVGLRRALRDGSDVAITPDGPRGPRYVMQPGIVKLAQSSGADIIPIHLRFPSAWRLRTWDGFVIPKPFSRVTMTFDEALVVPRRLADDDFERWRKKLENLLRAGVDDLDFEPKESKAKR